MHVYIYVCRTEVEKKNEKCSNKNIGVMMMVDIL